MERLISKLERHANFPCLQTRSSNFLFSSASSNQDSSGKSPRDTDTMPLEVRAVLVLSNGNLTKEGWGSVDGNTLPHLRYALENGQVSIYPEPLEPKL